MRLAHRVGSIVGLGAFAWALGASGADGPIEGIGPKGPVEKVHGDFTFTEGPAADARGDVYFTDVRAEKIYKIGTDGKLATFLEDTKGCNGLMFDGKGRLVACQGLGKKIIAIDVASKAITPLAESVDGQPIDRPNDLVVDRQGGVYFTDPAKGLVCYVGADGKASRAVGDLPRPNGVLLSPDEATLYVLPSGSPDVMAYPIERPGKLGPGRVLCKLEQAGSGQPRGGDGLTVDEDGNLYLTQPALGAIQVVSAAGKTLGMIAVPEAPSNCTFGGPDMKTLYITARTSLYAAPMEVKGHRFGGR